MLKDKFNRVHDYLRISITDRCNLRCAYCTPEDLPRESFAHPYRMNADEINSIVAVFVKAGIKKIRLTGGEPLVRKDVKEIIQKLSKHSVELTITTNGVFVDEFINVFKDAGLKSINVSLDTLKKDKYFTITKRDEFLRVKNNINLLLVNNFHVKINVVAMKNFNDDEILDLIEWTKDSPIHVRFIEFMPFTGNEWNKDKLITHQQILEIISSKYKYIKLLNEQNDTAKKYFVPNHQGSFAIISTMSVPFCSGCNRMRLTSDGKMYNCLFAKQETDLLSALRQSKNLEPLIQQCVQGKFEMLGGNNKNKNWGKQNTENRKKGMISLGG